MLGGGGHGALFMGVDSFINQREIAAGVRWGGLWWYGGRRLCNGVKRGLSVEGQRRVRGAFTSAEFKATCHSVSICLIVHSR